MNSALTALYLYKQARHPSHGRNVCQWWRFAGPVAAAVAELVHILLIIAAVLLGLAFVALVGFVAYRLRHRRNLPGAARAIPPARAAQPLPMPRPAIGHAPEVHVQHQ